MSPTILVTGGTGFLGSYIIKELVEKNYQVRAIRRSGNLPSWIPAAILDKVEWVEGDILDVVSLLEQMEGIDTVIHSAAIVSFNKTHREKMYHVNVEGTANVVNMALESGVRRIIYISSVAALGRTLNGSRVNEEKKWEDSKANTHYGKSKYKAELHVWRGMAEGLEGVILNPSTILGYGNWDHGSCAIFKNVYKGFPWYTTGINGFVDVKDVATITRLFTEATITEERYIVNGDNWEFKKLQDHIALGFSKKGPTKKAGSFLLNLAAIAGKFKSFFTGKDPLVTPESSRVALSRTWFENDKFLAAFPHFVFTPLEETISAACKKYEQVPSRQIGKKAPVVVE
jgi:dihydroflavonol-4-reductase